MSYRKPLPVTDHDSRPFWEAMRRHEFVLPRCRDCGKFHYYPRVLCPHCRSERIAFEAASGCGTIYTFTIARRPAGEAFADATPYVIALVDLEEGPRMMSNIVTADPDSVRIGQQVRVQFDDVTETVTLPKFARADE